jgi:hypothetical protein
MKTSNYIKSIVTWISCIQGLQGIGTDIKGKRHEFERRQGIEYCQNDYNPKNQVANLRRNIDQDNANDSKAQGYRATVRPKLLGEVWIGCRIVEVRKNMAKQTNNVVIHRLNGKVGDLLVFRQRAGQTVVSKIR